MGKLINDRHNQSERFLAFLERATNRYNETFLKAQQDYKRLRPGKGLLDLDFKSEEERIALLDFSEAIQEEHPHTCTQHNSIDGPFVRLAF